MCGLEPKPCAGVLAGVGLFCLIMGILMITEKSRFTPFYTPVKCDNLFLDIPVTYTLHVSNPTFANSTMVNGTMADSTITDLDYLVTVMGGPGGLADTGNNVNPKAAAITPAEFEAAPFVPVPTNCQNDNEFEVTMYDNTVGRVMMANPGSPTDYSTYIPIGHTTVIGDQVLPVQGKGSVTMGLKMQTISPLTKGLLAAVGVPQPGVTGLCPDAATPGKCVAPLFFDLDIKSTVEATALGIHFDPLTRYEDLLPKKFCAQFVKFRADAAGHGYLTTASPTYCRDSAADIVALAFDPAKHAEAVAGLNNPTPTQHVKGTIDQMDPKEEDVDPIKGLIYGLLITGIVLYFILAIVCFGFAVLKFQEEPAAPANALPSDLEKAA